MMWSHLCSRVLRYYKINSKVSKECFIHCVNLKIQYNIQFGRIWKLNCSLLSVTSPSQVWNITSDLWLLMIGLDCMIWQAIASDRIVNCLSNKRNCFKGAVKSHTINGTENCLYSYFKSINPYGESPNGSLVDWRDSTTYSQIFVYGSWKTSMIASLHALPLWEAIYAGCYFSYTNWRVYWIQKYNTNLLWLK